MSSRQECIEFFEGTRQLCISNPFLKNAMDIDEPVLVENYYSVRIFVEPGSYAERYCKENNISYTVK